MGSPPTEPDRDAEEVAHRRLIPHKFAVAAKEVSVRQYQEFVRENPEFGAPRSYLDKWSPDPDGPMVDVSWFYAAAYCNWLSRKEGLAECYETNSERQYAAGMKIRADALVRGGYRLPTEAEWEYACRAGATTSRYFGQSIELLAQYARYAGSSVEHAWPRAGLLPNDLGLFDILGNVFEWCNERRYSYRAGTSVSTDRIYILEHVDLNPRLLRGGAFFIQPAYVRSALRNWFTPTYRNVGGGFRPARTYN